MLILSRNVGEAIYIGDNIQVRILRISGRQVSIGIDAPRDIPVYRDEIYEQIQEGKELPR